MTATSTPPGRNSRCPCGSGKRYKDCCGALEQREQRAPAAYPGWEALPAAEAQALWQTMQRALAAQTEGRLDEAKALYSQVLARAPATPDALHMLGVIHLRQGDLAQAFARIRGALDLTDWRIKDMRHNLGLVVEELLAAGGRAHVERAPFIERPRRMEPRPAPAAGAEPEISAIVSTYASADFIEECLSDLVRQTAFDRMEVIVVDANSPENERAVVERYQRAHPRIRYIRTEQRISIYAAWNLAIRSARGRYITPFSTNDRLRPEAYAILSDALERHPEVQLAYGDSVLTRVPHQSFENHTASGYFQWNPYCFEDLLENCRIGPHPMWRRALHDAIGYFDEQFRALGDQEFWLRIGERYPLLHVPELTGLYWDTSSALSQQGEGPGRELDAIRARYALRYQEDLQEWVRRTRRAAALGRIEAMFMARFGALPAGPLSRGALAVASEEDGGPVALAAGLRPAPPQQEPLVSVLVSTYNSAALLRACLEDLERQTIAPDCEVIVIDSGSEQDERTIVREFEARFKNLVYLRTGRESLYAAWNRGIRLARGKYLTNANTDDAHRADALEALAAALDACPQADVAYGDYAWSSVANDTFEHPHILRTVRHPSYRPADGMFYCFLGCHPMWRRTVFDQLGCFDTSLAIVGDFEYFLRLIANRRRLVHVPEVLSLFYQNPAGLTFHSDRAKREAALLLRRYRTQIPLRCLFEVDPEQPAEAARAWRAQGVQAIAAQIPWQEHPSNELEYAAFCFEQALRAEPGNPEHLDHLAAAYALAGNWSVAGTLLERMPPERARALEPQLRARSFAFRAERVRDAVEPLTFAWQPGPPADAAAAQHGVAAPAASAL